MDNRDFVKPIVRECHSGETEAVVGLWAQVESSPSITDTPKDLLKAIELDNACVLVAEVGDELAGTVIGGFDGWRGNIYRLAVHKKFRRRGIASLLVKEAESRLTQHGARRITALVEKDHPWATGFWEAVGYDLDPRMLRFVRNP